jgi:hypothetical protein
LDVWSRLHNDYQAQAGRPFEHEARLKELLARQAQLNATLVLDKSDASDGKQPPQNLVASLAPAVFQASNCFSSKWVELETRRAVKK